MGSFQHVPSNPATADKKRGRSVLCDNLLGKPSRQQPPWAAHFSQYRNCAFPVMPTELKPFRHSSIVQDSSWCRRSVTSLLRDKSMSKHGQSFLESPSHKWNGSVPNNIPTGAAPLCQNAGIYVTLFLSQSIQWWTSQWASSIFTAFHALMSNHKRTLRCNRNRKLSRTPENQTVQVINHDQCRKDKVAQTCTSSSSGQDIKWWESTRHEK